MLFVCVPCERIKNNNNNNNGHRLLAVLLVSSGYNGGDNSAVIIVVKLNDDQVKLQKYNESPTKQSSTCSVMLVSYAVARITSQLLA